MGKDAKNIKGSFDQVASVYDNQRRKLIPCFDDFYGIPISITTTDKKSPRILDAVPALGKPDLGNYQNRAGFGPRLPLLVISPYAKANFVDHTLTDQSSILRFIEDNWNLGRIGDYSFDEKAGSITNMFDFSREREQLNKKLFLDPITGEQVKEEKVNKDKHSEDNNEK